LQIKIHPLFYNVTAMGIASSHPAACNALAKYTSMFLWQAPNLHLVQLKPLIDAKVHAIDTTFMRQNAAKILKDTPVKYLHGAQLRGSLFEENCASAAISCLDTRYFVDHKEPMEALAVFREAGGWSLGELPDGHEFLLITTCAAYRTHT
jgi:hypothetical protein